jgi:hypothetical protein
MVPLWHRPVARVGAMLGRHLCPGNVRLPSLFFSSFACASALIHAPCPSSLAACPLPPTPLSFEPLAPTASRRCSAASPSLARRTRSCTSTS